MNLDTRLSVPPQVVSRQVGDETVLLDLSSGLYFGLDAVGKHIWEAAMQGQSLAETIDSIVAAFEVDEDRARDDVIDFTRQLVERGLLAD